MIHTLLCLKNTTKEVRISFIFLLQDVYALVIKIIGKTHGMEIMCGT